MAWADRHEPREQARAAIGAGLVHALIGAALLSGLGAPLPRLVDHPLEVFNVLPPAPEPAPPRIRTPPRPAESEEARRGAPRREGAAAAPNLRSQATQIVAPPAIVPPIQPPPIIAAPVAGTGSAPTQGAAPIRGPGTGAGGVGFGRGAGAGGDGDGGGGDGGRGLGRFTPPRHLRGRLSDRDYPRAAWESGAGGTVSVRFTVNLEGRVVNCRITRSSSSAMLDEHTCQLIERRYRFDPSRDARSRPVLADVVEDHEWVTYDEPPEHRDDRR